MIGVVFESADQGVKLGQGMLCIVDLFPEVG